VHIRSPISMGRYLLSSIASRNIGYIPYQCKEPSFCFCHPRSTQGVGNPYLDRVTASFLSCHHISLQIHTSLLIFTQSNFSLPGQTVLHNLCSVMCILNSQHSRKNYEDSDIHHSDCHLALTILHNHCAETHFLSP